MNESANMQIRNLFGKFQNDSELSRPAKQEDAVARPAISWPIVNAMEKVREDKPRLRAAVNLPAVEAAPVAEPLAFAQSADAASSEISAGPTLPPFLLAISDKPPVSTPEPAEQDFSQPPHLGFWSGRAWAERSCETGKNSLDEVFERLHSQPVVPGPLSGIMRYMSRLLSRQ